MNMIETRIPNATAWAKTVTDVSETAKTGHDWSGDFVKSAYLVDLPVGTIVATCDAVGSHKHPSKLVKLYVLRSNAKWARVAEAQSSEWAYELRATAREWLAKTPEQRNIDAFKVRLAQLQSNADAFACNDSPYACQKFAEVNQSIVSVQNQIEALERNASAEPKPEPVSAQPFEPFPELSSFNSDVLANELRLRGFTVSSPKLCDMSNDTFEKLDCIVKAHGYDVSPRELINSWNCWSDTLAQFLETLAAIKKVAS